MNYIWVDYHPQLIYLYSQALQHLVMIYLRREAVRMLLQLYIILMSLCQCNKRGKDYQYINTDLISSTVWRNTKQLSLWGKQVPYLYNSVSAPFHTVQNYCSDSLRVCWVIPMQKTFWNPHGVSCVYCFIWLFMIKSAILCCWIFVLPISLLGSMAKLIGCYLILKLWTVPGINHLLETVTQGIVCLSLLFFLTTQEVERAHKYLNTCWRLDMPSLDTQ